MHSKLLNVATIPGPTPQIQGNVDREMAIAASLVAQGKKDRALLALKRKKLQARRQGADVAGGRGTDGGWLEGAGAACQDMRRCRAGGLPTLPQPPIPIPLSLPR